MEPERIKLEGFLDEFRTALEEEIETIKKSGQSSILLRAGHRLENGGAEFRYIFKVDYMPTIPADTPCKLVLGNERYDVSVISCDGDNIIVASDSKLPDMLGSAQLENGSTVLMELLIKCIEKNADKNNQLGRYLICDTEEVYQGRQIHSYSDFSYDEKFTEKQKEAVNIASTYDVSFIWGPPGTGKTTVIGKIVDEVYKNNRSILVVSHTNIAVDGAVENAYKSTKDASTGISPVLRLGTPVKALPNEVLLDSHVKALGKELHEQKAALMSEKATAEERLARNTVLIDEDNWIKNTKYNHIEKTISELNSKEKIVSALIKDVAKADEDFQKGKEAHPNYADYYRFNNELKEVNEERERRASNIVINERKREECLEIIDRANTEARMHVVYADLREQESKLMPLEFLRKEINSLSGVIESHKGYLAAFNRQKDESEKSIAEYEAKSSVAKFFSSKNSVEQAQESLKVALSGIAKHSEAISVNQRVLDDYNDQIQQVLALQERERAVTPSKTKEYWESLAEKTANELTRREASISECRSLIEQLDIRRKELELKIEVVSKDVKEVSALESALVEKRVELEKSRKDVDFWEKTCQNLLNEEYALGSTVFDLSEVDADVASQFTKLSAIKEKAEKDLFGVDIGKCREEKEEDEKNLRDIGGKLGLIEAKIQQLETEAIMNAKIVGTTLSKAFIDEKLRERSFDTVILDEASMASIPSLWCASLLAESSVIIVGDFLQLPPIYVSNTELSKKWLGTDVFHHSGMVDCLDAGEVPNNFVMLHNQFRMESDIAALANKYYAPYAPLISDDNNVTRVKEREEFYEWCTFNRTKGNVFLINTESLHAWVTGVPQGKKHSRLNSFSASISVDLAFKVIDNKLRDLNPKDANPVEKPSVIIIAPYRPHIDRVRKLIDLEYKNRGFDENLNYISAGTVHSFQGNEADVVIFDLVVDEPHWKCNLFMPDDQLDESLDNMFNVAITRAKFKLFIIGNFSYCRKRAKANSLSRLLDCLLDERKLKLIDARLMFPSITFERRNYAFIDESAGNKHLICTDGDFYNFFMSDLQSMKKRMVIYSAFMTENRVSILLPAFADAINANKEIIVVTKTIEEHGRSSAHVYQKIEEELENIGVTIVHKQGMHEKIVIVDDEICWYGSLNVLSNTGNTGETMTRYCDLLFTRDFEKAIDLDAIYQAIGVRYELRCPVCNEEMLIKEGAEGSIYWECSKCGFSRKPKQQYPVDGEIKCTCGGSYKFVMKNEPRWVCTDNPKHYQKVNKSDLKLTKMLALITKADQKRVQEYFEEKLKKPVTVTAKVKKKTTTKTKKSKAKTKSKKTVKKIAEDDGQMKLVF